MAFTNQITVFINDRLKAGSLNNPIFQPGQYFGIASPVGRKKSNLSGVEILPGIPLNDGKIILIAPDDDFAIQLYHKVLTKTYSYVKGSRGDNYDIKSTTEMSLIVLTNNKRLRMGNDRLEPIFVFGFPQRLPQANKTELGINSCAITPVSSNLDPFQVGGQEYPQNNFITTQNSIFQIRYRIEMSFSQACIDKCICDFDETFTPEVIAT